MNERASLVEQYATRGWSVFPCKPGQKQPATRTGCNAGTPDLAKLRFWWSNHDYNIGINCGRSGLAVIDLDVVKDGKWATNEAMPGITWWLNHCEAFGTDPYGTYSVVTPSGGLHLYYGVPDGEIVRSRNGVIASLVDIKSEGGYVLAAGSETNVGKYEWTELTNKIAVLPEWLCDRVIDHEPDEEYIKKRLFRQIQLTGGLAKDFNETIRRQTERVMTAAVGQRNEMLNIAAYTLFRSAPDHLVETIKYELQCVGQAVGLSDREINDTLKSALRAARSF